MGKPEKVEPTSPADPASGEKRVAASKKPPSPPPMGSAQPRSTRLLQLLTACLVLCCSCMAAANGCLEKERIALLQLRDSFYHPRPANLSEWPTWVGEDCCSWVGVSCPDAAPRRVVSVSLASRRRKPELGGMVVNASLFAALEELQRLLLNDNQISGWIEPKGMLGLKKLQKVDLGENLLTDESVSWLFDLPSLAEVDLSRNKLRSSSTLKRFCGVKRLTSLTLDFNAMEGTIDPCVGNMLPLQLLSLQGNLLTGEIPSLTHLSSLETLVLGQNRLSGVFHFSSLAGHTNLTGVSLGGSGDLEVDTELPAGWVPSFQLYGLALSGCSLNRRSGRRIPSFLSTQTTRMSVLALSRTLIQGTIPAWLLDNVDDTLLLDGNNLSGPFPRPEGNITLRRRLSLLDLSKNQIHGPMPPDMKTLLPELYHMNLSWNAFAGGMASFGQLGYLGVLDVSHNSVTGEIPAELTADGSRLRHLRLSHNQLTGTMLPPGSRLAQLAYLFLENNRLTGPISPDLAKSPSLAILNLRGNLLSGALPRGLFALPSLAAVLLSGNRFRGPIPAQLCAMRGLRMLDLSANSFSGAVPRCLSDVGAWKKNSSAMVDGQTYYGLESVDVEFWTKGRLEKLRGDDLNLFTGGLADVQVDGVVVLQLTGAIPVEVGAMAALRSLNISRNHISGGIPSSLQGLELIESLDLSHNQLTGSVPPQIASLRYLSVFCVAYNKLSERIPYGGHFSKLGGRCS